MPSSSLMAAVQLINNCEDFLDRATTASSFSGRPYEVRCGGGASMKRCLWLRDELV
ncbi:MAG: DUF5329 family protein [Gallionellaceae bacterium]|nr:DUF5329 family protein [Gallionellaceae bacterium]